MALNIPCPYCGLVVPLPDDYLGAGVRCPQCAIVFAVQQTALDNASRLVKDLTVKE